MAKKKEITVEDRLRALFDLQLIDSRVDEIRNVRGELPLEVRDLEDEVAGLHMRLEKLLIGLEATEGEISGKKLLIDSATGETIKDLGTVELIGHRLSGNAGSYGFDALGFVGKSLEEAAKNGDWDSIEKGILDFNSYLENLEIVFE